MNKCDVLQNLIGVFAVLVFGLVAIYFESDGFGLMCGIVFLFWSWRGEGE